MIGLAEKARRRANRKAENDSAATHRAMAAFTFGLDQLSGS
jgi:hypothetical protein